LAAPCPIRSSFVRSPRICWRSSATWPLRIRSSKNPGLTGLTYLRAHGIKSGGHNVVVYFDEGRPEFRVEIGADVFAPFAGSDGVVCSATPGGRVATTRHIGPYSRLAEAHSALRAWCREARHSFTGVSWEVYGHWNDDPAKLETDVFYQLAAT
jgi:effector-binding domain-containing protein